MLKIGVLEDNPTTGEFLTMAFYLEGHQAKVYSTGPALIAAYKASAQPLHDVLIIDQLLPGGLSGTEVLRNLRQLPNSKAVPAIFLTGAGYLATAQLQEEWPNVPVLMKPTTITELRRAIQDAMQLRPG